MSYLENETGVDMPPTRQETEVPLRGVRSNIVQSIRAFRVPDLQDAARSLGHHFLYANLAEAQSKQEVLDMIGQQFTLPDHVEHFLLCLLYTSPSPRDRTRSRMPSSA